MSLTLDPDPTKPTLAYDLIEWFVAGALAASGAALFVDGELAGNTPQAGKFHMVLEYLDDTPANCVVCREAPDTEQEEFVPRREVGMEWLIRAQDKAGVASGQARAKACVKALQEFLRDSDQRNKTMVTLPSGRVVLAFKGITSAPAGLDVDGRYQYLLQFRVLYRDSLTQTT